MIWKRLRNLWRLSAYEPMKDYELPKDFILAVKDKPKQAIIIKKADDIINKFVNNG